MAKPEKDDYTLLYDYLAKKAASAYLAKKFTTTSPAGYRGWRRERYIQQFLDLKPEDRFLDIGCASGRHTNMAAEIVKESYGVDISEEFIKKAKESGGKAKLMVADAAKLPFDDDYFDKILCGEVLEHVRNLEVVVKEMKRVLKKGGIAVVTVPQRNADATVWKRIKNGILGRKTELLEDFSVEAYRKVKHMHIRSFIFEDLKGIFEREGFKLERAASAKVVDFPFYEESFSLTRKLRAQRAFTKLLGIMDGFLEKREFSRDYCAGLVIRVVKI